MFIYQNGKLYVQDGNKFVGVEIYSDKITKVKGTEVTKNKNSKLLSHFEVRAKFQLDEKPYIFPVEKESKVEVKDEPTPKAKATPRKSTRK